MTLATAGPSALWYLARATGAVTLILLTVSLGLGIVNVGRFQAPGWPRFVVEGVHRNVSLLAVAVLAVHIAGSVLDPFASIHVLDAFIPFISAYRPIWLGLGAFACDLLLAVALTSVVRRRLGHRVWRATHWLAYVCWPVAVLHGVGTGSDIRQPWMLAVVAFCVLVLIVAVWARLGFDGPWRPGVRPSAFAASLALPIALALWLPSGPLAANWAARSGTPKKDLPTTHAVASAPSTASRPSGATTISAFTAPISGAVSQSQTASGLVQVTIVLTVSNGGGQTVHVQIDGQPLAGGGVAMTSSSASIGPASSPSLYRGAVVSLSGTSIVARVSSADGHSLTLDLALQITAAGGATGTIRATPA